MQENNSCAPLIRVKTENVDQQDTPEGRFPDLKMSFLPLLCNHCSHPPCVDVCPPGALAKREDGPVILDKEVCDGCEICIEACPFDAILYNPEKRRPKNATYVSTESTVVLSPSVLSAVRGRPYISVTSAIQTVKFLRY